MAREIVTALHRYKTRETIDERGSAPERKAMACLVMVAHYLGHMKPSDHREAMIDQSTAVVRRLVGQTDEGRKVLEELTAKLGRKRPAKK